MKFTATSLKTKKTKQVSKGISKESQPELYNISKAIGTLDLPDPEPVTEENLDLQTLLFLDELGCAVVDGYDKNTTLLDDNEDIIENPNIQSKNVVKSKKQKTDKSFPNEDDPFYTINKQKEESRTNNASVNGLSQKASKTRKLVVDLSSTETTNSRSTTRTTEQSTTMGSRQSTSQITRRY